jgi:hypothetical protein
METNVGIDGQTFADSRPVIDLDLERLTLFFAFISPFFYQPVDKNFEAKRCGGEENLIFHEGGRAAVGVAGQSRTEFSRFDVIIGAMMMSLMTVINQPKCWKLSPQVKFLFET